MAPDITLFPIQQTMPSPLISVIVPIYNMESLLPRCLDSLAAQTLRDLEIICVDDGSTDGSGGIVRKYASGDSRFRLITQENSGRAEARNAGIRAAAAPYLGFADPDDYVEPDMYPRVPGRENSRTAPAPSLRPAGTAKGTGMPEKPPRTMKRTNERKPPNYFPCGEKRLPPQKSRPRHLKTSDSPFFK